MKAIYLIRHAKSSWKTIDQIDHERPLNKRGTRDFPLIASRLKQVKLQPELIICSNAKRTKSTAELLCKEIDYSYDNVNFDSSIYEAPLENLLTVINKIPSNLNDVVLIGHNPGITLLSNYLTEDYIDFIPTSGVVKIELEIDSWDEIVKGIGLKKFFLYPKML